jgi:protein-disulfide isomerase
LPQIRLLAGLLALSMASGCKAQSTPPHTGSADPALDRHIEVMVRSQFNIPQDYDVTLGARTPSQIPGYNSLPVIVSHGGKKTPVDFLISADNKTLARLEKFNLAADPAYSIDVTGRPIRGNPAAKVTVITFDDLQCPFCARMHQQLFPSTLARYQDKVRFIYRDFPLVDNHPWAVHAAVDANCLAALSGDAYWNYVDYLHTHGDEVTGTDGNLAKSFDALNRIARQEATLAKLGPDKLAGLDACIAKQDETAVRASLKDVNDLGLEGAPALYVNGERINGAVPEEQVWLVIDRALRAAGIEPPAQPALPAKPVQAAGAAK